jgi:hypothetical protein
MAIGPFTLGSTRPSWVVTFLRTDNSAIDLTGATYTGVLYELRLSIRKTLTVGNYSTTNATAGIYTYAPGSVDVDTAGLWQWETVITIGGQTYTAVVPNIRILDKFAP